MKFVLDPGYANEGQNLIHVAAEDKASSVLQTFFEIYDCASALGKITKSGCCALTCAVCYSSGSNVEFLRKEYGAADVRTIKLIVQNALQRKEDRVLEVMRTSKVLSDYLRAEQSGQKALIRRSAGCVSAIDGCQTTLPCHIKGESLLDFAGDSRSGANEDIVMEDAA